MEGASGKKRAYGNNDMARPLLQLLVLLVVVDSFRQVCGSVVSFESSLLAAPRDLAESAPTWTCVTGVLVASMAVALAVAS